MTINLERAFANLDDMEQIEVELEAEERGVSVHIVLVELIREGFRSHGIDEDFQDTDRQWKSH